MFQGYFKTPCFGWYWASMNSLMFLSNFPHGTILLTHPVAMAVWCSLSDQHNKGNKSHHNEQLCIPTLVSPTVTFYAGLYPMAMVWLGNHLQWGPSWSLILPMAAYQYQQWLPMSKFFSNTWHTPNWAISSVAPCWHMLQQMSFRVYALVWQYYHKYGKEAVNCWNDQRSLNVCINSQFSVQHCVDQECHWYHSHL